MPFRYRILHRRVVASNQALGRRNWSFVLTLLAASLAAAPVRPAPPAGKMDFSRDVLPVLSENCFFCHGPDAKARKAKLRLDAREGAIKVAKPGAGGESELIRRINAAADDGGMPPPESNRKLTADQKSVLRRWVDEGMAWGEHWAYAAPRRQPPPTVQRREWTRNDIDKFVLARLETLRLTPAPEAPRTTLIRRLTLDLTGLPPTSREVDVFVSDSAPDAYERLVDRLLASPRYGERMAADWLDDARFADTNGYQNDFARSMWLWRDWVVDAFNRNQPFDQFVIEQVAGDLLPTPTLSQRIATGFNRNNRTVTEAGSIDEEWRIENAVDRVETTATVFLGLTLGCARCHDHKFDPISQKEFYQFLGYFNSLNEKGVYTETRGNVPPLLYVPTTAQEEELRRLAAAIKAAADKAREEVAALPAKQMEWEARRRALPSEKETVDWTFRLPLDGGLRAAMAEGRSAETIYKVAPAWVDGPQGKALKLDGGEQSFVDGGQSVKLERTERFSYGLWVRLRGDGALLSKMDDKQVFRGFDLLVANSRVQVHLVHAWADDAIKVESGESLPRNAWTHVFVTYDGSSKAAGVTIFLNGRPAKTTVSNDNLRGTIATQEPLRIGRRSTSAFLNGDVADVRFYPRSLAANEVQRLADEPIRRIIAMPAAARSKDEQAALTKVYRQRYASDLLAAQGLVEKLNREKIEFTQKIPTVMVMEDLPTPRPTYVLKRGRYDMPDATRLAEPATPACLSPPPSDAPHNRLGLARWLVAENNPLTARVAVNRFWQRYFGVGLVKTAENFGVQGELPSHPELLDWLALEFQRTGWNVKAMQRLIVLSAAYRQSSAASAALIQRDPENRLLARSARFRLPAEMVRDGALAAAGLLVEKIGGPSIKPYQPAGLWEELAGGAGEAPYIQDKAPDLYRRSLYIYRKRTVPHPLLATFDASSREVCQVKSARTNTPLQALDLLNDVTYVEAARRIGELMLVEGGRMPNDRVAYAFRRILSRPPEAEELRILASGHERYRRIFRNDAEAAKRFIRQGESPVDAKLDPAELAACAATASVLLNLDEAITRD